MQNRNVKNKRTAYKKAKNENMFVQFFRIVNKNTSAVPYVQHALSH